MKFRLASIAAAAAVLSLTAVTASAADYVIDTKGAHASVSFKIKHLGFSWLTGRFDKFDGTFKYDPAKPEASSVEITIDTASVNTNHGERDKHLRSADFLNVEKYPTAKFVSTKIVPSDNKEKADIVGDLTLNGVTKVVTIEAEHVGGGNDPWGGFRDGFTGKTALSLKDFGVKMDLGPASQVVELTLHVEGIKK